MERGARNNADLSFPQTETRKIITFQIKLKNYDCFFILFQRQGYPTNKPQISSQSPNKTNSEKLGF